MPDLIIEPEALNALLNTQKSDNIVIVDLGKEERFLNAHIPGAVLVTPNQTQAGPPIPGLAPSDEQLTELMQGIGLQANTYVVVYDDEGGGWAGRFIWLLDEIGHDNYSYLNGGIHAWAGEGYELENGSSSPKKSSIQVANTGKYSVTKPELLRLVESQEVQIWDARSPMEHNGSTAYAARAGRIPGSFNYEWTRAMDQQNNLKLKPSNTLIAEINQAGLDADKATVTHCQTHHRSGLTYLLGKALNFKNIKAYPGSWGEWGNSPDTPVVTD